MKNLKNFIFLVILMLFSYSRLSVAIERIEPPFWWAGMLNPELQLMAYGKNISQLTIDIESYDGVELTRVTKLKNPNYLVIDLQLDQNVLPGSFCITFKMQNETKHSYTYVLKKRKKGSAKREGFNSSDVIYLITPDRFANGNPDNDSVEGFKEKLNRDLPGGRHGGDIQGILDNLDYIKDMGFTSIWLNPVLENDMPRYSYHGYSTTDYYKIDERFGNNEMYKDLSQKAKEKGIKLIMDQIFNHVGSEHFWMKDLPTSDWINFQDDYKKGEYTITNHKKTTTQDPYVARIDLKNFVEGWFVSTMPDLNQRNPNLAKYLIQNSIWWVEYADLSGIRADTYGYPGKEFMAEWSCQVMAEYPNLNIVGEEWKATPSLLAFWQRGKNNPNGYKSCLPSLIDFPLQEALIKGINDEEKRFSGWISTYEMLAKDFVYADPFNLVVFGDNHDMSRFFTYVNEDFELFKLGITFLLTVRGIPQIFYGTEILMKNPGTRDHGIIRADFPGGWRGDDINAFTGEGLSDQQKKAQKFMRKLLNWRKNNSVIHKGKLIHYCPRKGVYVYFRYDKKSKVMIALSKNKKTVDLELDWYKEALGEASKGLEVISGKETILKDKITVPAMSPVVIDIRGNK
jgi:neopullulanase